MGIQTLLSDSFAGLKKVYKYSYGLIFSARSSIKYRLMFFLTVLSLVPLLILGIVSYSTSKVTIDKKVRDYSRQLIRQTAENIDIILEGYKDNMMLIITNSEIVPYLKIMLNDANAAKTKDPDLGSSILTTKLASFISTSQEFKSVSFVSNNYYIKGTYYCTDEVLSGNSTYYKQVMKGVNNFSWFPTRVGHYGYTDDNHSVNVFSLGKQVYNLDNMGRLNLAAVIDIREDVLSDICSKSSRDNLPTQCFIIDEDGIVISHPDKSLLYKNVTELFPKKDIIKFLMNSSKEESFETSYRNEDVMANVIMLKTNNWRVVNVVKSEYLYKESNQVINVIFLMSLVCIVLSFTAAYFIARSISNPLKSMVGTMRQVVAGNLKARIEGTGNKSTADEVAVLQESFNYMVSRLQELIEEVYEEQNNKRIAEIKALEAQINPHFLYNTLDTIKWTALFQKANNAAEMTTLLSRLLHISLSKGKETIFVHEEIEHVQCYLGIQKFRFNFNINVSFNIDEDTKYLKTPKLILQPIVENSILHGLAEKNEGGSIKISCSRIDGKLKFEILDNGCGIEMDDSNILKESKRKSGESFSGIGIGNVDERIKLICGKEYGIVIDSKVGAGTKVDIWLPIIE